MRVRFASGDWGRVVGDLRTVARGRPFRVALAISVLLHVALFVFVRWDPAGFAGSRGARMLHLHLIEEAPAPAAPIAAAGAPSPAAASVETPTAAQADERSDREIAVAAQTGPGAAVTGPVAESASAGAALAVELPAPIALPATPIAPAPADAPAGVDAPATTGAQAVLDEHPAQGGSAAGLAAGQAQEPDAAAPVPARGGATPVDDARGAGGVAGDPGGVAEAGVSGGAGAPDVLAVRRRIDARKVYPRVAVRNGWEGRVLVEMRLDRDGGLKAVRVVEGSGHAVLDDATIASVRRASPFPPVAGTITVPVEYRLTP